MLSAIVAMDSNRVIGYQNQMPWHLPADLKHFKTITMGHSIIMGRNTYDSLGKPLPGRKNIVITRRELLAPAEVVIVSSVQAALQEVSSEQEAFIIGGQNIFLQTLDRVQRIYLTRIEHTFNGDRFFPELNHNEWQISCEEKHMPDERNIYPYTFLMLERKK